MTENKTWQEIYDLIDEMKEKTETQKSVTRTISRINYANVFTTLANKTSLMYDKNIQLRVNVQDGILSIMMKRK